MHSSTSEKVTLIIPNSLNNQTILANTNFGGDDELHLLLFGLITLLTNTSYFHILLIPDKCQAAFVNLIIFVYLQYLYIKQLTRHINSKL